MSSNTTEKYIVDNMFLRISESETPFLISAFALIAITLCIMGFITLANRIREDNSHALWHACYYGYTNHALTIIYNTNNINYDVQIDTNVGTKITPLISACQNNMTNVALALIATGKSAPEIVSHPNGNAFTIALRNNMTDVAFALYNYFRYERYKRRHFAIIAWQI